MSTPENAPIPERPDNQDGGDAEKKIPISFDAYGTKVRVDLPKGLEVPEPESARDIWPMMKDHLAGIAVGIPGLADDLIRACRGVARGIGGFLPAINGRIERGRAIADTREDQRQMMAIDAPAPIAALPAATGAGETALEKPSMVVSKKALESDELLQFLEYQKTQGKHVAIRIRADGLVAIIITKPEAGPAAEAASEEFDPNA